jgi:hypothetical protein
MYSFTAVNYFFEDFILYFFVFPFKLNLSKSVLRSWSRKEPHLLVGAGAVTRCGSGSDNGIYHG